MGRSGGRRFSRIRGAHSDRPRSSGALGHRSAPKLEVVPMVRDFARMFVLPPLMLVPGAPRHFSPSAGGRSRAATADDGLSTLFESSTDPMLVIDSTLHVAECNPAAARLFRTTRDRLKGAPVLEIDLLALLVTAASIPQRLKTERSPVLDQVAVSDPEGQPIQCRIEALALRDGRTLVHLTDTTQSLRSRAALRAAEQLH